MGWRSVLNGYEAAATRGSDGWRRAYFATYFPRVFAYVQASVQDEAQARDVTATVFTTAFSRHANADDGEFRIWLFAEARHALQAGGFAPGAGGLTNRERDVVSLLFDAQLTRPEVATLLSISADTVAATLLKALRKLREAATAQPAPFLLRTT